MRTSARGLKLIMRFEGFSATPYLCPAGIPTIGYGHVLEHLQHPVISRNDAKQLLAQDARVAERAVTRLIRYPLAQHQFDALVSFTFNVGSGALQRSSLRAMINRGEVTEAADQFLRWVYGGGKKLPGLVKRRTAERALFLEQG